MVNGKSVTVAELPVCDIHKYVMNDPNVTAYYDGKTWGWGGRWAYMCADCFYRHGIGLGVGRGQQLILREKQ